MLTTAPKRFSFFMKKFFPGYSGLAKDSKPISDRKRALGLVLRKPAPVTLKSIAVFRMKVS